MNEEKIEVKEEICPYYEILQKILKQLELIAGRI